MSDLLDKIKGANDRPIEAVEIPEWDCTVYVRLMSGAQRDRFEVAHVKEPTKDIRARIAACTLADADGKPLFDDLDEGIRVLNDKAGVALDRIVEAAVKLNALGKKDVDKLQGE